MRSPGPDSGVSTSNCRQPGSSRSEAAAFSSTRRRKSVSLPECSSNSTRTTSRRSMGAILKLDRLAAGRRPVGGLDQGEGLEVVGTGSLGLDAAAQAIDPMFLDPEHAFLHHVPG